jgi:hypothetical protein
MRKNTTKNLVTLIKIFQDYPELFAKKLLEHDVLRHSFLEIINNNAALEEYSKNPAIFQKQRRHFYSLSDIDKFYNQFFIEDFIAGENFNDDSIVYNAKNETEALLIQLRNAIIDENYELAAQIKKYMQLCNIDIPLEI